MDKFKVSVVLAIFVLDANGENTPTKCAFYDKDSMLSLPTIPLTVQTHANQGVLELLKQLVPIDPKLIHILPIGFFDPILSDENQKAEREILLGYRVFVSPGMPIAKTLEFKDHEQLRIAAQRISPNHFRVFRAALYN